MNDAGPGDAQTWRRNGGHGNCPGKVLKYANCSSFHALSENALVFEIRE